jgi:hypothetical protein
MNKGCAMPDANRSNRYLVHRHRVGGVLSETAARRYGVENDGGGFVGKPCEVNRAANRA